jgi:hypothetical protein
MKSAHGKETAMRSIFTSTTIRVIVLVATVALLAGYVVPPGRWGT